MRFSAIWLLCIALCLLLLPSVSSALQVNTFTASSQQDPSAAVLSDGGFVIVWESFGQNGTDFGVFGQRFDASGKPVGGEFPVNTLVPGGRLDPAVAGLSDGGFVVVSVPLADDALFGQGSDGVFVQRFDASSNRVGGEFQVNTFATSSQEFPAVTGLSDGGFVVAWDSFGQDGSQGSIVSRRFDASGNPVGDEFRVNTSRSSDQTDPAVAALSDGGFVVTWDSFQFCCGAPPDVFGKRFDASGNPGGEFQVNSFRVSFQGDSTVAGLSDGGFVVAWTSFGQASSHSSFDVFGQRFGASGSPVGGEFQVNTFIGGAQRAPAVAGLSDGGFVVLWQSFFLDGDQFGVFGQRFDASGNPVGGEFQVNTFTTDDQERPSVAALGGGGFVVTWQSFGQDGDGFGVFATQFPLPNRAPVAVSDVYAVFANRSLTVTAAEGVLANDSDPEEDPLTAVLITGPTQGSVSLSASGAFTYAPNKGFVGVDTFTYRATDGLADSNFATVTITIEAVRAMPWLLLLLDD